MDGSIRFLAPHFLFIGASVFVGFLVLYGIFGLLRRLRAPAIAGRAARESRLPGFVFFAAVLLLAAGTVGGYFGYFARPVITEKRKEVECDGAYILFVRDSSDSTQAEGAFLGRPPHEPDTRLNIFWAENQVIRRIVTREECFRAGLVDFQIEAGAISGFRMIPKERSYFLDAVSARPVFAPGSYLLKGLRGAQMFFRNTPDARGRAYVVLLSDGGERLTNAEETDLPVLKELRQERIPVFAVVFGKPGRADIRRYNPFSRGFEPILAVTRHDGTLRDIALRTNGNFTEVVNYRDLAWSASEVPHGPRSSLEQKIAEVIRRHRRVIREEWKVEKETDIGRYFFLAGTVSFALFAGFGNFVFLILGFPARVSVFLARIVSRRAG